MNTLFALILLFAVLGLISYSVALIVPAFRQSVHGTWARPRIAFPSLFGIIIASFIITGVTAPPREEANQAAADASLQATHFLAATSTTVPVTPATASAAPTVMPEITPTTAPTATPTVTPTPPRPTPTNTPQPLGITGTTPTITAMRVPYTPTSTVAPTATPAPPAQPSVTPESQAEARVTRVVDGDTIEFSINGKSYTVRYIGVDTPETVDPRRPVQCFGREATAKNKALVEGQAVKLEKDVSETDRYGRLLRYVYVGNNMINAELVRLGYAKASAYPPDVKYQALFERLEAEAREANRGLWSPEACLTPVAITATPTPPQSTATATRVAPTATAAPARANCDPSYPDVCIPPPPPDLDCKDVPYKRFRVVSPDPHRFDGNNDGIGCEN